MSSMMKRSCRAIIDVLQGITWDRSSDAEKNAHEENTEWPVRLIWKVLYRSWLLNGTLKLEMCRRVLIQMRKWNFIWSLICALHSLRLTTFCSLSVTTALHVIYTLSGQINCCTLSGSKRFSFYLALKWKY